ncbi:MAG TPA: tetratricopeptide repeat protein, partial [Gemmatimonadaceae bacterium]
MFRWGILAGAFASCAATIAVAQTTTRPTDPVFVRAQALVSDGNGIAGRALIDSVLTATPPGARLYPEALFWRATLASNAADAESDYKHLVVDYPLAPQAEDALLRLAQLELARGDRDGALTHLQRIPRDYPRSKSLARASYWTARVLFEKNDIPNACAANANALSKAGADEIELRNQIQYQGQRCPSPAASVASVKPPVVDTATSIPAVTATAPAVATAPSTPTIASASSAKDTKAIDTVPSKPAPIVSAAAALVPAPSPPPPVT